jgi:hypothetical protein
MSIFESLRKGFGYVLLTMGVSRPAPKPRPAASQSGSGASSPNQDRTPSQQ